MRSVLQEHPQGAVISAGSICVEVSGREILHEFSKNHHVIFVIRDADDICQYLRSCESQIVSDLIHMSSPMFRELSSYEFYNLSDQSLEQSHEPIRTSSQNQGLLLKNMESDFLRLIYAIRQQKPQLHTDPTSNSLSLASLESRHMTYALALPLELAESFVRRSQKLDIVADAVELIISIADNVEQAPFSDAIATQITRQYGVIRRAFQLPIIIHIAILCKSEHLSHTTARLYIQLAHQALRLAPEYLTIDVRLQDKQIRHIADARGPTKLIGHFHDHNPRANAWSSRKRQDILRRINTFPCVLARLCQEAISTQDNYSARLFRDQAKSWDWNHIPIIAYNTGHRGRASRSMNPILSPVTHHLLSLDDSPKALGLDGLLEATESQSALFASFTLEPQFFGIFGADILASLAPDMQNEAFRFWTMPHKTTIFQRSSLRDLQDVIRDPNFGGASVAAPFKQAIIPMIDDLSPASIAIGAVNTLIPIRTRGSDRLLRRGDCGKVLSLYGDNTDWIGVYTCIRRNLSPVNNVQESTTALVIGAGGMSQAAVYGLIHLGIRNIFIYNRTRSKAEDLVQRFDGKCYSSDHKALEATDRSKVTERDNEACGPANLNLISSLEEPWPVFAPLPTVIISCVPGLTASGETNIKVPDSWLGRTTGGVFLELTYNPPDTSLLRQVRKYAHRGWIFVHGLEILAEQGMSQWEVFTGRRAPKNHMRQKMCQAFALATGEVDV
ncbi:unnamed protein product [Clonostachys byssicola]|uniref:Quinate repressor protein n=1 Tax=Clonostachys byssicola TaxID=160290 RepID=A0A9N9UJL0_9HYPO|nr:unnamed protein product [Clonostachys byssicola]